MGNGALNYFKVVNFKRFDELEVSNIGKFNLIVGNNNVGKTCLLEALLFDEKNFNQLLYNFWNALNQVRKIEINEPVEFDFFNYLDFYIKNNEIPIQIDFSYNNSPKQILKIKSLSKSDLTTNEINALGVKYLIHQTSNFIVKFDLNGELFYEFTTFNKETKSINIYYPLINFGLSYQEDLIDFFSIVSRRTTIYDLLLKELKQFIPLITSIEINNAIIRNKSMLTIRESNRDEIKPISFYGDGLNKFFRYLVEILLCEGKRLLIDEIDTGIHYSKIKDNLKALFRLAKQNEVQIFATTHSKECLEYYKDAIEELGFESEARIIRLVELKNKQIKAYTYTFEQFEQSLDNDNEIR